MNRLEDASQFPFRVALKTAGPSVIDNRLRVREKFRASPRRSANNGASKIAKWRTGKESAKEKGKNPGFVLFYLVEVVTC